MIKTDKIKIKNIFVILLLFSITCGIIKPVFSFSGEGNANWTGGQYDSFIKTTESILYNRGILIRKLTNKDTGEKITVFCAEHKEDFAVGTVYNGDYYKPTDEKMKKACKIAYFGWYNKYGDLVVDIGIQAQDKYYIRLDYVFTQQYIWEALGQSSASFLDENIQRQYNLFKVKINKKIANMEKRPSFSNTTVELEAGNSKVITDTNGVLKDYSSIEKVINNIKFTHIKGENTLSITVSDDCEIESLKISEETMKSWGMIKEESKNYDTTIYFSFSKGVQNQLYSMHYNNPIGLSINVKVNLVGKLELTKLNSNGDLIDGSIFRITGPNNFSKEVTVTNGKIYLEGLKRGIYTIKEIHAPEGYLINTNLYKVIVEQNEITKQTITNQEPKGSISIIKEDSKTGSKAQGDASLENAVYKIYANEDIYNVAKTKRYYYKGEIVRNFCYR